LLLAVHVLGDWKAEVVQQRGRQVEDRSAFDLRAVAHVGPGGEKDTVGLMVEVGRLDVHRLLAPDPALAALEAVVREEKNGCLLEVDSLQDSAEELILISVPLANHIAVAGEPVLFDPCQTGRVILHEKVRETVHLLEVHHEKVVRATHQELRGDGRVALSGHRVTAGKDEWGWRGYSVGNGPGRTSRCGTAWG